MTIRLNNVISPEVGGLPHDGGGRLFAVHDGRDETGEDTSIVIMRQTQYSDMERCKYFMQRLRYSDPAVERRGKRGARSTRYQPEPPFAYRRVRYGRATGHSRLGC
ncbi:hypothetical protein [Burkholderia anthina]|uniref:hypothetical protein n=1 Tax=Burkholderia anthina TaxID=179879 RepID=UPI00158DA828